MHFTLLRSFLAVSDEGSFTAAAERLHLSQPTLTRQIAALEADVGGRLFERKARGVALTSAGQALAKAVRGPLGEIERALVSTRRISQGERAEVRIGYLQSMARGYLQPAVAAVRATHPAVRVKLVDLCAGGQMRALQAGEIDVALIGQEGRVLARDFYVRKVRTLGVVVVLPESHRLAARPVLRLRDLGRQLFIAKSPLESPGYNEWVTRLCRRAGFRPRFGPEAESMIDLGTLALSEDGVALLPELVGEFAVPSVVARPLADTFAKWELLVVWQRGRMAAPVRTFLEALPSSAVEPAALRRTA